MEWECGGGEDGEEGDEGLNKGGFGGREEKEVGKWVNGRGLDGLFDLVFFFGGGISVIGHLVLGRKA